MDLKNCVVDMSSCVGLPCGFVVAPARSRDNGCCCTEILRLSNYRDANSAFTSTCRNLLRTVRNCVRAGVRGNFSVPGPVSSSSCDKGFMLHLPGALRRALTVRTRHRNVSLGRCTLCGLDGWGRHLATVVNNRFFSCRVSVTLGVLRYLGSLRRCFERCPSLLFFSFDFVYPPSRVELLLLLFSWGKRQKEGVGPPLCPGRVSLAFACAFLFLCPFFSMVSTYVLPGAVVGSPFLGDFSGVSRNFPGTLRSVGSMVITVHPFYSILSFTGASTLSNNYSSFPWDPLH